MNRRSFIKLAGGGVITAAGAGGVGYLAIRSAAEVPDTAVAAWSEPKNESDVRRFALSYAILAPNPHNMQPWIADLNTPEFIKLRLDPSRLLPATDPLGRQILMGAGGFLELLSMAAKERGRRVEIELFPDGPPGERLDGRLFAQARLVPDAQAQRDPLFRQTLRRRTDRRAYDPARAPYQTDVQALFAALEGLPVSFGLAGGAGGPPSDAAKLAAIRAIAREAWRIELTTETAMMESIRLLRIGGREIDLHRDGIAITSTMLYLLTKAGLFDRTEFPAPTSAATTSQISDFDAVTASTPAYLWIVTKGNSRDQQIAAGRAYARVNLAGTALGLAMHPNQQSLQEYPEMAMPYRTIHALLDAPSPDFTVQMLARTGYLPTSVAAAPPAPRRGLAAHLAS